MATLEVILETLNNLGAAGADYELRLPLLNKSPSDTNSLAAGALAF